jgi:hypothetical protein
MKQPKRAAAATTNGQSQEGVVRSADLPPAAAAALPASQRGSVDAEATRPTTPAAGAARRLRFEYVQARTLDENPANWRKHGEEQLAGLKQLIDDPKVGWAGALLWNERTRRLIDGHGRKKVVHPDAFVPVLIGNWSEEEERTILLTLDPIAQMAGADQGQLHDLLAQAELGGALQPVEALLEQLAGPAETDGTELVPLEVPAAPAMSWVLIGIPTVRFGDVAPLIEQLAAVPDTFMETTSNDYDPR